MDNPPNTEAELESFRRKWREEVQARNKGPSSAAPAKTAAAAGSSKPHGHEHTHSHGHGHGHGHGRPQSHKITAPDTASHTHSGHRSIEATDETVPYRFPGLGEKQHGRRLDETPAQTAAALAETKEPQSAVEHYEKAVEEEAQGRLGDALNLYRRAFKLDDGVYEKYNAKHYPPSFFKNRPKPQAQPPNPSVPSASTTAPTPSLKGLSTSLQDLLADFATLSIQGEPAPTDLSPAPPCPIATIPEELLVEILEHLAILDLASFTRLAQVCKRLAYLVATEDRVWKRVATGSEYGFGAMHYDFACGINGKPLGDNEQRLSGGMILGDNRNSNSGSESDSDSLDPQQPPLTPTQITHSLVPTPYPTFRALFRLRPRIRFNGCYISTVNYTRPGAASTMTLTWGSPIHIVTYYRYLRFLRDGTCISLLTTAEPADVVPYLYTEHMHKNHGALPSAPMKDALLGRWRLSGPQVPGLEDEGEGEGAEKEGSLVVETAAATPKYTNKMVFTVCSAGKAARSNKLAWQGYWNYNILTDDWGEYGLKNDRPFYWSRVRSYGMSWKEAGIKS